MIGGLGLTLKKASSSFLKTRGSGFSLLKNAKIKREREENKYVSAYIKRFVT